MGKGRDLEEFRWTVFRDSYQWVFLAELNYVEERWRGAFGQPKTLHPFLRVPFLAVQTPAVPYLTDSDPLPGETNSPVIDNPKIETRSYNPLRTKELYQRFAALNADSILGFSEKFGHLGISGLLGSDERGHAVVGESRTAWINEITEMRLAIRTWERVVKNDRRGLEERIHWDPEERVVEYQDGEVSRVVYSKNLLPQAGRLLKTRDPIRAGYVLVLRLINERLTRYTCSRLLLSEGGQDPGLRIVPQNLLGAIWYQFARVMTGNWRYRTCDLCGQRKEIAPQGLGRETSYCSNACRQSAHRKRKKAAALRTYSKRPRRYRKQ